MTFYWRDGSWIARGGALISATGALTLFAEWTSEADLARHRKLAEEYVLRTRQERAVNRLQYDRIAEVLDSELHDLRLPIVSISAALLAIGSILQAVGDFLLNPILILGNWAIWIEAIFIHLLKA
jgi:hypothetical protein